MYAIKQQQSYNINNNINFKNKLKFEIFWDKNSVFQIQKVHTRTDFLFMWTSITDKVLHISNIIQGNNNSQEMVWIIYYLFFGFREWNFITWKLEILKDRYFCCFMDSQTVGYHGGNKYLNSQSTTGTTIMKLFHLLSTLCPKITHASKKINHHRCLTIANTKLAHS